MILIQAPGGSWENEKEGFVEAGEMKKRGRLTTLFKKATGKGRKILRLEAEVKTCMSNIRVLKNLIGEAKKHNIKKAERKLDRRLLEETGKSEKLTQELKALERPDSFK